MIPLAILDRSPGASASDPILFMIWLEIWAYLAVLLGLIALVVTVAMFVVGWAKSKRRAMRLKGEE